MFELKAPSVSAVGAFAVLRGFLSHEVFSWDINAKRNRIAITFDIGFKRRLTLQAHTYEKQLIFRV